MLSLTKVTGLFGEEGRCIYLEVPVHDAVLVQVANGLQDLLDHTAGVLLRVHASVQDTVKELAARNTESRKWGLIFFPLDDVRMRRRRGKTHSCMIR